MKKFNDIIDFIKDFENFEPVAYKCPAGILTLGYGSTIWHSKLVKEGMTCTEEQASEQLWDGLVTIENKLIPMIDNMLITSFQYKIDAIVSYAYNAGLGGFPNLLRVARRGDSDRAAMQFLDGFYCNGKPLLGLLLRRISEYRMFTLGVYERFEEGDRITPQERAILLEMNSGNIDAILMIKELPVK